MPAVSQSKYMVNAGWDDVPHLDTRTKKELLDSTPPFLREARSKGIPSLGSGAIYPIALDEITVQPFAIPNFWRRNYGLDVGWNRTAAVWLAENPDDGVKYFYAEHYMGQAVALIHAASIMARGDWIMGAIDPAARNRSQDEGKQLMATYQGLGMNVLPAVTAVEPGLYELWAMFSTGKLKVFSTLQAFQNEYRLYRRDENGKVVKKNDHMMDAARYAVMTFEKTASIHIARADMTNIVTIADRKAGY
jgi:hypothetical protein